MIYRVIRGRKQNLISEGPVYIIEAEYLEGSEYPELFLFPDDEYLIQDISEEVMSNDDHIWEPDEEDYTEGYIYDIYGNETKVFRFMGLNSNGDFDWGQYLIKFNQFEISDYQDSPYRKYPSKLLKLAYNCFVFNEMAENVSHDEYTTYYVYSCMTNQITTKQYQYVVQGECVLSGTIDMKSFVEWITPRYGNDCAVFFLNGMLRTKPWYPDIDSLLKNNFVWVKWFELTDIANDYFSSNPAQLEKMKMDIAYMWLKRINKE